MSGCGQSTPTIADYITLEKGETRKLTYEDYTELSSESVLSLEQTLRLFDAMNWNGDAFLYFPITPVNLLQIAYEGDNRFLVEITNDSEDMIYHQKYASRQECREIISAMFERDVLNTEFMSNFYKVPIKSKTLDDVMNQERNASR